MMKRISLLFLILYLSACNLETRKSVNNPERQEFLKLRSSDKYLKSEEEILAYIKKYPKGRYLNAAFFDLGRVYFKKKNYSLAEQSFNKVKSSNLSDEAKILRAHSLVYLERYAESYAIVSAIARRLDVEDDILKQALLVKAYLAENFEKPKIRLLTYDKLLNLFEKSNVRYSKYPEGSDNWGLDSDPTKYWIKAMYIIDSFNVESLLEIQPTNKLLKSYLYFKLGKYYFENSDFELAKNYLNTVRDIDRGEYREKAQSILDQMSAKSIIDRKTIGIILPISGTHGVYGKKALLGITKAFEIYNSDKDSEFELVIMDSKNNESVASRAVEELVTEHHCIAIIGGLLSKTSTIISEKAQDLGIPNITLSQKDGITDIGKYIFRNAMTLSDQIDYLVKTAIDKYDKKNFGVLYPNTKYGIDSSYIYWQKVLQYGGNFVASQSYDHVETDFSEQIKKLVGTYYTRARKEEYDSNLEKWKSDNPHMSARSNPPSDLLKPIINFDALFIPDDVKALGQISPMLSYNDVDDVLLMGTNLWNTRLLQERITEEAKLIYVDSFDPKAQLFAKSPFKNNFFKNFEKEPSIIELQSYDAGVFLRTGLAKLNDNSREKLRDIMENLRNVPGALGKLSLKKDSREVIRPLVLFEHIKSDTEE